MIRVECIENLARFPEVAEAWDRLVLAALQPSPMLLSDWLMAWMATCGKTTRPLVLTAWEGERLVGGLALCQRIQRAGPLTLCQELRFPIGLGANGLYLDMLVDESDPARADRTAQALLQALGEAALWDRLRLCRMLPDARMARALQCSQPWPGAVAEQAMGVACPVLPLPETMDALAAGMDPVFRTMLFRKNLKLPAKTHEVAFVPRIDGEALDHDLDRFFHIHTQRWNAQGRGGEFARPEQRQCYRLLAHSLAAKGMLRFSKVLLDGEAHSYEFGVQLGRHYFALQAGISPEGLACQAGTYHLYQLFRSLLPSASQYHFMEGGEAYKYKWGAVHQAVQDGQVWCGLRGRVLRQLRKVRNRLRRSEAVAASLAGTGAGTLASASSGAGAGERAGLLGWAESLPAIAPTLARACEVAPLLDAAL